MPTLLSNSSATGTAVQWPGGRGLFALAGTVSGAMVTLQVMGPDAATYLTAATALTAVGIVAFELPPGLIRALVASGSPSGLYASAEQTKG